MKRTGVIIFALLLSGGVQAFNRGLESNALSMVPKGKIIFKKPREFTLKTAAGTKIKLEFERKGQLQEASGLNLSKGDEFEPGGGLLSLNSAAEKAVQAGHQVKGEWNLERDMDLGWVYELAEEKMSKITYHILSAKTGRIISSIDVLPEEAPQAQEDVKRRHQWEASP